MPPGFTAPFTEWLTRASPFEVIEAKGGEPLRAGQVIVAAAGTHLEVVGRTGAFATRCQRRDPVSGHCPSVDVMMTSVATSAGRAALGVVMTGMGADGAAGLLAMRRAGARTFAQDQSSCVVFGMPRAAHELGAAERLVALDQMAGTIMACVRGTSTAAAAA
jgi:two-component system chemotaxis response regulator CheB